MRVIRKLSHDRTVRSALGLLILQFFSFLVPFLSLPWIARVLGPELTGLVVFWQSIAIWGAVVIEYGFTLSGSRDVARDSNNLVRGAETADEILSARLLISIGVIVFMGVAVWFIPGHRDDEFIVWTILLAIGQGMTPAWYFRGRERLTAMVVVTIVTRLLSTGLTIMMVKSGEDAPLALGLQSLGASLGTLLLLWFVYREVQFRRPTLVSAAKGLRDGWDIFLIGAASSVYGATGPILLGMLSSAPQVAFWGTAERLNRVLGSLFGTLNSAVFARISGEINKSRASAARLTLLMLVGSITISLLTAGALFVGADLVVDILYGAEFAESTVVLRIIVSQIVLTSISRTVGILWMIPLGMERTLNRIVIGATVCYIVIVVLLVPRYGAIGMAAAFLITETVIVVLEVFVVWRSGNAFWLRAKDARMPSQT